MAISSTSFDQRLARINSGQTVDASSLVGRKKKRRSLRTRCMTFPFFVGVGILVGGTAYAAVSTQPDIDIQWVIAEIQSVIRMASRA